MILRPPPSRLAQFRAELAAFIVNEGFFATDQVHEKLTGDLLNKVERQLGELGYSVVVSVASAREAGHSGATIWWKPATYWIDICQNVALAAEGSPSAWDYAEAIVAALKLKKIGAVLVKIPTEDIEEINPRPDQDPNLLIVRVPVQADLAGNTRSTT